MQISPESLASSGSEDGHQKALIYWCWENRDKYPQLKWLHHSPNGGSRHGAEAAKFKVMGVKSGFPDLVLLVPRGKWHGLLIELKKEKGGKTSKEQSDWGNYLIQAGYGFKVCHGWKDARDTLISYLEWKDG